MTTTSVAPIRRLGALVVVLVLVMTSCGSRVERAADPEVVTPTAAATVSTVAQAAPVAAQVSPTAQTQRGSRIVQTGSCADLPDLLTDDFSAFAAVAESIDVIAQLAAAGPLTVFAPTDEAFARLAPDIKQELLSDADLLTSVLQYHVVRGALSSDDLRFGALSTLLGSNLAVRDDLARPTINAAVISRADLNAGECTVHALDSVLFPPELFRMVGTRSLNAAVAGDPIRFSEGRADLSDADLTTLEAICMLVGGEGSAEGLPGVQWTSQGSAAIDTARSEAVRDALVSCNVAGLVPAEVASLQPSFAG